MSFEERLKLYDNFFDQQGSGFPVFQGIPLGRRQRGEGIGSILGGIFKYIIPLISKVTPAIKSTIPAIKTLAPKMIKKAIPMIKKTLVKKGTEAIKESLKTIPKK